MNDEKFNHMLNIENREKASLTGIKDVLSFDDQIIILETEMGMLTIKGENLRINKLSIDTSDITIEGMINSLSYTGKEFEKKNGTFVSKLFK